jgi:uncharacterized protein HemY
MKQCCVSSPVIIVLLNNVARLRLHEARYTEAKKVYREAEKIALRQHGSDRSGLAHTYRGLAEASLSTNRQSEAQAFAEKHSPC